MVKKLIYSLAALFFLSCKGGDRPEVTFVSRAGEQKVDILVDGKPFTSFLYADDMEKQVLFPIRTASGRVITRGYPLEPRPFERVDHPHHYGLWFNHGNVNGIDFWNTVGFKPHAPEKYGHIRFRGIAEEDPVKGELTVLADWVDNGDSVLLSERTVYAFSGNDSLRTIRRVTTLTARTRVVLGESKEGMFGIRLDRAFEEATDKPQKYTDENALPANEPFVCFNGVSGLYRNAEGLTAGEVWGKRSRWVAVRAEPEGEPVTIAIFDHRSNPNYPAWSHARGYGLFAANNLGGRTMDPSAEEVKIELREGEKITFKFLVVIGGDLTDEHLDRISSEFR